VSYVVERFTAFFVPPFTANYSFYVGGDDVAEVQLSVNESDAAATVIASMPSWCDFDKEGFYNFPSQISRRIPLVAGKRVWFRAKWVQVRCALRIIAAAFV
jgi:hypothetical protein